MSQQELNTPAAVAVAVEKTAGQNAFVEALIGRYDEALRRFLARRTLSEEDAEDIVQEVYYRIGRKNDITTVRYPQAYIFRTAINLVRDRVRRDRTRERSNHFPFDERLHASEVPSPERVLEGKQRLAIVCRALEELSPKCRHVFVLHRFEDMTYAEIAAHLGITVSAIEKHMMKAIAHLNERMGSL